MEKIAYITNNIAPFRVMLLDEMAKSSEVTLFYVHELEKGTNPNYVNKRPKLAKIENIKKLGLFATLKRLLKMDYIVIDGYAGREKLILVLLLILRKKSYSVSIDGIIYRKDSPLKNIIKKFVLKNAKVVLSTSTPSDNNIRKIYEKANIKRHIFTTLYQEEKDKLLEERLSYLEKETSKDEYILYVGKFWDIKGVREFVSATKNIKMKKIMVGGTNEELENLGCEVDDSFEIIPFLEKEGIMDLMKRAKLFVLPTYTDTWGLVIVEAASIGVPVVTTTNCNAGLELIKDGVNGYLCEIRNDEDLEEKIKKTLDLDALKVGKYNKELFENYSLEQASKNMLTILKEER